MNIIFKTKKYLLSFVVFLAFFSFTKSTSAATEFISVVDTGSGSGYDYSSLSSWENAMTNTATDLTSANTKVFSGPTTGSINLSAREPISRGFISRGFKSGHKD